MGDYHTIQTKSGHTFTPLLISDVLEVVRDEMGDDVFNFLFDEIYERDYESELAEKKFNSDYNAIESENEGWHQFVEDMSEEIEQLREKIESTGITKAKISVELFQIYEKMRKEL